MLTRIVDISLPLTSTLPCWPGTPGLEVRTVAQLEERGYNETHVSLGAHVGTHVDAPSHFLESEKTVDTLPLEVLIGEAYVADVPGEPAITAAILETLVLPRDVERILFKTDNSRLWTAGDQPFREDFVALTLDGAEWLVTHGVRLVGIDYLSIQRFHDSNQTHIALLEAGVVIVEGLNLSGVVGGKCELLCLPLAIAGVEGAPARAVLRY